MGAAFNAIMEECSKEEVVTWYLERLTEVRKLMAHIEAQCSELARLEAENRRLQDELEHRGAVLREGCA